MRLGSLLRCCQGQSVVKMSCARAGPTVSVQRELIISVVINNNELY